MIPTTLGAARRFPLAAMLLAAATALAVLVFPAASQAAQGPQIRPASELWTPLSGSVFDHATSENVSIQSNLLVVWHSADTGGGGTLHVNVADSTATGVASGNSYSFTGADEVTIPSDPIAPINLNFRLQAGCTIRKIPGEPIRGIPCEPIRKTPGEPVRVTVAVQLIFNERGQLTGATAQFSPASF